MTESACSHEAERGSKDRRAGSSASPECGPDPVTTVPRTKTTTASATVAQPNWRTIWGAVCRRGPGGIPLSTKAAMAAATRPMDTRKWAATVAGLRPVRTVMPPSTAWTPTPTRTSSAGTSKARRRSVHFQIARTAAMATKPTRPVRVRLPNSMYLWKPSACSRTGVYEPGTHCGQLGQPRPLPVRRTRPPVTTMSTSTMTLSRRMRRSHGVVVP